MAIRKHVEYLNWANRYSGYITFGQSDTAEERLATKALVFMVSGINEPFKIPVAYFFVDRLAKEERAFLLNRVIEMVIDCGIVVKSVTSDGDRSNIAAFKELGANFDNFEPRFFNKNAPNETIYVHPDPSHMLKNARNVLGI